MKIIFLGTPVFAVPSLDILVKNGYDIVAVITAPDKPSGRGQKLNPSDVKQYALQHNLKIMQPQRLIDPVFLAEARNLHADLQVVVAFRMLPEALWSMPRLGTFNLHGSLLPQYRGAAPINRAVMNGERVTGVTTFFLKNEIDTGNIAFQQEIPIGADETAGELHDRMMITGAELVLKTVKALEAGTLQLIPQEQLLKPGVPLLPAPKIFREDGRLDFSRDVHSLHHQVRGLSPFPGTYFFLDIPGSVPMQIKVLRSAVEESGTVRTHTLHTDGRSALKISAANGFLHILELQLPGKKRMKTAELLRGFRFPDGAVVR